MSKFDKFLETEPKSRKVEVSPSGKVEKKKSGKREKTQITGKLGSVKVSEETYEKVKLLKMATGESQILIMEKALTQYFEEQALTNDKVKAFQTLMNDFRLPNQRQMTMDEFM